MRVSVVVVLVLLTACAANPRTLCASLVPTSWRYMSKAPAGADALERSVVGNSSIRQLWYQQGEGLLLCTLSRDARDTCSVEINQFARSDTGWVRVSGNAVLCHVTL